MTLLGNTTDSANDAMVLLEPLVPGTSLFDHGSNLH